MRESDPGHRGALASSRSSEQARSSLECRRRAQRALELSSILLDLANGEREECEHDGCLLLDGILRDCALQIRRIATVRLVELASADDAQGMGRSREMEIGT